jgi:hypothetical protein
VGAVGIDVDDPCFAFHVCGVEVFFDELFVEASRDDLGLVDRIGSLSASSPDQEQQRSIQGAMEAVRPAVKNLSVVEKRSSASS